MHKYGVYENYNTSVNLKVFNSIEEAEDYCYDIYSHLTKGEKTHTRFLGIVKAEEYSNIKEEDLCQYLFAYDDENKAYEIIDYEIIYIKDGILLRDFYEWKKEGGLLYYEKNYLLYSQKNLYEVKFTNDKEKIIEEYNVNEDDDITIENLKAFMLKTTADTISRFDEDLFLSKSEIDELLENNAKYIEKYINEIGEIN